LLREYGQRAALRDGNPYRPKAYIRAADSLSALADPSLAELETAAREDRIKGVKGLGAAPKSTPNIAGICTSSWATRSSSSIAITESSL
jgi:Helix-hairpin-helix domain